MEPMELFFIGLGIGLLLFILALIHIARLKRRHKREMLQVKNMVSQKMDLEYESITKLRSDVERLKKQNENLRISLRAYSQKPNRKEMAQLQMYQRAIDIMNMKAPGFAPAWQLALKESEEEMDKVFLGLHPFVKKVVPGRLLDMIESKDEKDEDQQQDTENK